MPQNAEVLFEAALELPEDERLTLVSRILDTMPADSLTVSLDDPQLMDELERRFADSEGAIPWSELRAEA
jgi:putative addiction module component (TIGR02574 family)